MQPLLTFFLAFVLAGAVGAQERVARVGYLSWGDSGTYEDVTQKSFVAGLREEGFIEGKNVVILRRSSDYDPNRVKAQARELARAKVDVFFAPATAMAGAAWAADRDTPIVIATILDPVALELVKSLARPGTRVTGVTAMRKELIGKRMELIVETVPGLKRVGVMMDYPMRDSCKQEMDAMNAAAKQLGLTLSYVNVGGREGIDAAYRKLADGGAQALVTSTTSTRRGLEKEYADAAVKYRLPYMGELDYGTDLGGLISYGPNFADVFRRAGIYAGRILKGSKPADMPIEEPTRFELVVNLKTAKALGLTIPQSILVRADRVIE